MQKVLLVFTLFVMVLLTSCSDFGRPCTANFVTLSLRVVDETDQPVSGVNITVTLQRTGKVLDAGREQFAGDYVITDDLGRDKFSSSADRLMIVGSKDNKRFQTQFEVRNDGCHIEKISGPEVVVLK